MLSNFYVQKKKIQWDCKLITKSPLHIGSGLDEGKSSDAKKISKTIINNQEIPYIPGSSLKGVFRTTIEQAIRSGDQYYACDPLSNDNCGKRMMDKYGSIKSKIYDELKDIFVLRKHKDDYGICISCSIFGSQISKATSIISDFFPNSKIIIGEKTSTAISRENGNAKRKALFKTEFIEPNSEFFGKFTIDNPTDLSLGYFSIAPFYLNRGYISLGGFTSNGFGNVEIQILSETVIEIDKISKTEIEKSNKFLLAYIKKMEDKS